MRFQVRLKILNQAINQSYKTKVLKKKSNLENEIYSHHNYTNDHFTVC